MAFRAAKGDDRLPYYRVFRSLAVLAATIAVFVSILTVFFLEDSVRDEVEALAAVNSDTTQWTLAQSEVDLLKLMNAARAALADESYDLGKVRRQFDILYSRIVTIKESRQFTELRSLPATMQGIEAHSRFLDSRVSDFDGPDAGLRAALPGIISELELLSTETRRFSLQGVSFFAKESDRVRSEVATLLKRIGLLTFALVASLFVVVLVLFALFRQSARSVRAADEARSRLQEVISTSIDGILAVDKDGRVIDYNGAAEGMFGYSREEALGNDMASLIIPNHLRSAHNNGMERYRATGERRVVGKGLLRLEAMRKDGSVFPVEVTISSASTNGQEIFVSYLRDISQRVEDERELIEARDKAVAGEKAKANLLAVMSHEMRTPLNGLLGTMELLEHTELDPSQSKYLSAMETSAKLLLHHVNDVLGISRAEAGQLELEYGECNPAEVIEDLVESQRQAMEARGNRARLDISAAPETMWTDPIRLRQVILNLLGNANKFTKDGEISIECEQLHDGRNVEIRVIDTGIGIAEADHERIFEDFRTLDSSFGRRAEGTGLGLGIARRLVKAMGGEIGVESEIGEGSLFWIRLPIGEPGEATAASEAKPAKAAVARDHQEPGPMLRVLLVEDNEINRLVARNMLEKAGHSVTEASDGREGVDKAHAEAFDVILMDISMPELDGMEATALIRMSENPNRETPVIALTAHALPEHLERFREAGMSDTLTKPLSMAALDQALGAIGSHDVAASSRTSEVLGDLADQLGAEKVIGLLERFIDETDAMFRELRAAPTDAAERKEHADLIHKMAGSASLFGIDELTAALKRAELSLRDGSGEFGPSDLSDLRDAWQRARDALDAAKALSLAPKVA